MILRSSGALKISQSRRSTTLGPHSVVAKRLMKGLMMKMPQNSPRTRQRAMGLKKRKREKRKVRRRLRRMRMRRWSWKILSKPTAKGMEDRL